MSLTIIRIQRHISTRPSFVQPLLQTLPLAPILRALVLLRLPSLEFLPSQGPWMFYLLTTIFLPYLPSPLTRYQPGVYHTRLPLVLHKAMTPIERWPIPPLKGRHPPICFLRPPYPVLVAISSMQFPACLLPMDQTSRLHLLLPFSMTYQLQAHSCPQTLCPIMRPLDQSLNP